MGDKKMIKISNYNKGLMSIIASAFCFALLTILAVLMFKGGATPITILIGRFSIASLLFLITILIKDRKLLRVKTKDIKWFIALGAILFAHVMAFWYGFQIIM